MGPNSWYGSETTKQPSETFTVDFHALLQRITISLCRDSVKRRLGSDNYVFLNVFLWTGLSLLCNFLCMQLSLCRQSVIFTHVCCLNFNKVSVSVL